MTKTVEDLLTELQAGCTECAPAHSHSLLVSGKTTIRCSQDGGVITWQVDGRAADRACAGRAIEHARAHPKSRFTNFHPKG